MTEKRIRESLICLIEQYPEHGNHVTKTQMGTGGYGEIWYLIRGSDRDPLSEGSACDVCPEFRSPIEYGKSEILYEESDIAIIFVGHMFEEALKVREDLKERL